MQSKTKKPFYKRVWFILLVVLVAFVGIANMGDSSEKADSKTSSSQKTSSSTQKNSSVPKEYTSALKSAQNYNKIMHMSKAGLYEQLTADAGDKFSPEAAQYAVDNLKADYNENALKSAETYQKTMNMSPESIREQLTADAGDKFTQDQANYAIDHLSK
ncbi:Ltp family lipoprotein [Fructobacillus papyrifericola]|uniref:Putative host cell surface-exposed lipoprotein Ltp-like HTH region domain-containing protein n=1 Tax=Fructobacillus papyrifericola TaxID=2713172 RepID=A0ABS5QWU3_9LACO|nr:Ltp family lipoprotein [Fructobacillus papyrifericola]MBS9336387.1 hypothetical protein [Fructobacillus papyrifericola]